MTTNAPQSAVAAELEALLENGEPLEPIADIFDRISGRRPAPSTTWRICRKATGRAGVLPARLILGRQCSTEACVRAWLARKSEYAPRTPPQNPGPSDDELRSRGLLD